MKNHSVLQHIHDTLRTLWAVILVTIAAACHDDCDEATTHTPSNTTPIAFNAATTDGRGVENGTTWANTDGSQMAVWAYYYGEGSETPQNTMIETTLTYNAANTRWDYAPVVYWPLQGTMDFFAYAPARAKARREFTTFSPSHVNHQAILLRCHVPASEVTTIHQLADLAGMDAGPNDAARQEDLMFAFQRNVACADRAVTDFVTLCFAHVMAGLKLALSDERPIALPTGTAKVVFGIGRLKTGGTLAICEPAAPGGRPSVVWTLDGQEGTFYITADTADTGTLTLPNDEFFFPPQTIEGGLRVTAYFYDTDNHRLDYREVNTDIQQIERGKSVTITLTEPAP